MADSTVTIKIEDWVRNVWMKNEYGQSFSKKILVLNTGGNYEFDAVSEDDKIVGLISTSSAFTASGNRAPGPNRKIKADILYFTMIKTERKLLLFTEDNLYKEFVVEKNNRRIPNDIELVKVNIPEDMNDELKMFKSIASKEVTPKR